MLHYDVRQLCDKRIEAKTYKAREALDEAINEVSEAIAFNRHYEMSISDEKIEIAYKTYKQVYWLF